MNGVGANKSQKQAVDSCATAFSYFILVLLLLCGGLYIVLIYVPQNKLQAELDQHKALWTRQGSRNYVITVYTGGGIGAAVQNRTYVQNNTVIATTPYRCQGYCDQPKDLLIQLLLKACSLVLQFVIPR